MGVGVRGCVGVCACVHVWVCMCVCACVCVGVCASIKEPVTKDILLQLVETERWLQPHPPTQDSQQVGGVQRRGEDRGLMPPPKKMPRTEPLSS